jgi:hypothetical protein
VHALVRLATLCVYPQVNHKQCFGAGAKVTVRALKLLVAVVRPRMSSEVALLVYCGHLSGAIAVDNATPVVLCGVGGWMGGCTSECVSACVSVRVCV